MAAYNFARRPETPRSLTPYETICRAWTDEPSRFTQNPHHQIPGPNTGVRLVHVPAEQMATLGFSGSATSEARAEHARILGEVLAATSRKTDGPVVFLGYDPPFSLPLLRRNEVAVHLGGN